MLKLAFITLFFALVFTANCQENFYKASDSKIEYTGRVDFSNTELPRFWSPGVYITFRFKGTNCSAIINDEVLYGTYHNYIEITVDNESPRRIKTTGKTNTINIAKGLKNAEHVVTITKNTESGIGYLELVGLRCEQLLPPPQKPSRKIEFIGNSITCGFGSDLSEIVCNKGEWYDQHNAYMSYGAITARQLDAQYFLTAVSGIGLIHSCCNMTITMPQVYDKVNLRTDSINWDVSKYQPDVVTICLGQNDGVQDSTKFCTAYVTFINTLRNYYPNATIVCLTSPMGDATLTVALKKYINAVVDFEHQKGDNKIGKFVFSKQFNHGCGGHPDVEEHKQIAHELTSYLKELMKW